MGFINTIIIEYLFTYLMSVGEISALREELSEWVGSLENTEMLELLRSIKYSSIEKGDWWDTLSDKEKENIEAGLKDLYNNHTLTSKQFWQRLAD